MLFRVLLLSSSCCCSDLALLVASCRSFSRLRLAACSQAQLQHLLPCSGVLPPDLMLARR